MSNDRQILRGDVVAEPVVAGWYAWPHLISPAPCAMNVLKRHLRIMQSYVAAPHVHAQSVKDPKMAGGPFIDYPQPRVAEIRQLIEWTQKEQAHLSDFAHAVRSLSELLKSEATGACLDPLYAKIPEPLRGYVEIFYDLSHRPSFRFFESLLYRSRYYDPGAQALHIHVTPIDNRPFILSTPRLPDPECVSVSIPFESASLERLSRSRYEPVRVSELAEDLGVVASQRPLFQSLFTTEQPRPRLPYEGDGVRIRYFGLACVLLQTHDVSLFTDPVVSFPYRGANSRYTNKDQPPQQDNVLITHNHQDHVLLETLLQLRHMIGTVIVPKGGQGQLQDPSLKLALKALGFKHVVELDELETIELRQGAVLTGLPFLGEHADLGIRTKLCYHVAVNGWSTLFAADSSAVDARVYKRVHAAVGNADALIQGKECDGAPLSWLYGALLCGPLSREHHRSRTLSGSNFERAVQLVETFRPREVYVYAMGQEPWLNHIMALKYTRESLPHIESDRLLEWCRQRDIIAERLYCIKETFHGTD